MQLKNTLSPNSAPGPTPAGRTSRLGPQAGFTLVELMIGLTIGLIVLLGLTVFFSYNSRNQNELEKTILRMENAQYSLNTLTEDLMHAGYFGRFAPVGATSVAHDFCPQTAAELGWAGAPAQVPNPVEATAPDALLAGCLPGLILGNNFEVLSIAHTETSDPVDPSVSANLVVGNTYVQTRMCDSDPPGLGSHFFRLITNPGVDSADFDFTDIACTNAAPAYRMTQKVYYLASCNDCSGSGDGIPTLWRADYVGGAAPLRYIPIAPGIERIRFEYGLDTSGDGQADTFVARTGVTALQWQDVVSVRIGMLTRSLQPEAGYADNRVYTLTPTAIQVTTNAPVGAQDGVPANFKRSLLTTTVPLYNVSGRRE